MSPKPLTGFVRLFAQELPELEAIDTRIREKLAAINLSPESPLTIMLCHVDASRYNLLNSRFGRRQHGLYLLMDGEVETSVRCLHLSNEEYVPALKGVVLAAKLLLKRETIPYVEFELLA